MKGSSLVEVLLARPGAVVLAELEPATVRDLDEDTSPDIEGLCEAVPTLATGGVVVEEEASLLAVAACICCVDVHMVH